MQDAAELGAPVPTIAASVEARVLSSDRAARLETSERLHGPSPIVLSPSDRKAFVDDVRGALYAAKACAYAQGMNLLRVASRVRNWSLDLASWRGSGKPAASSARSSWAGSRPPTSASRASRTCCSTRILRGARRAPGARGGASSAAPRPGACRCSATTAALGYYDSLRRVRLPAHLIQAQRDSSGPTPTSASTARDRSTPTGTRPAGSAPRALPEPRRRAMIRSDAGGVDRRRPPRAGSDAGLLVGSAAWRRRRCEPGRPDVQQRWWCAARRCSTADRAAILRRHVRP